VKHKERQGYRDMNKTTFTMEECSIICIYAGECRNEVIEDITMVLPYLDDMDLKDISQSILRKLQSITDEEYKNMEFCIS